jgi:hypothetical protein
MFDMPSDLRLYPDLLTQANRIANARWTCNAQNVQARHPYGNLMSIAYAIKQRANKLVKNR